MTLNYDDNEYKKKKNLQQKSQGLLMQQDGTAEKAREVPYKQSNTGKSFPLAMACEGERLQIAKLKGSEGTVHRLIGMGLVPGAEIKLINIVSGSVIVAIGDNRIGLGMGMAQKVMCIKQLT